MLEIAKKNLEAIKKSKINKLEDHIFLGQFIIDAIKTNNKPNRLYENFSKIMKEGKKAHEASFNNPNKKGSLVALTIKKEEDKQRKIKDIAYKNFIKEAIRQASPPMTVYVTSQKSSSDLIKSFQETKNKEVFFNFWIEQKTSNAYYMKEIYDHEDTTITKDGRGFLKKLDEKRIIDEARKFFLYKSFEAFGKPFNDLTTCRNFLHSSLVDLNTTKEDLKDLAGGNTLSFTIEKKENTCRELEDLKRIIERPLVRIQEWEDFFEKKPKRSFMRKKRKKLFENFLLPSEKEILNFDNSLEEIRSILKDESLKLENENKEKLKLLREKERAYKLLDRLEKYNINFYEKVSDAAPDRVKELFDSTIGYHELWYAIHYYEARFLMGEYSIKSELKHSIQREDLEKRYRRLAMICPLIIMDFDSVPYNLFSYISEDKPKFPLKDFIDLIIIDNASEVEANIGANLLYFAKRAILLGKEEGKSNSLLSHIT